MVKNNNREWERCPCGRPLKINDRGDGTGFLYCYKCEPELRPPLSSSTANTVKENKK